MSLPQEPGQSIASKLRQQLEADDFARRLESTTLFRNIPLSSLPLTTLEHLCEVIKLVSLPQNQTLKIGRQDVLYEILSGYVKIYDRAMLPAEMADKPVKNPPALLAWRIPRELLGDFQFSLPGEELTDHIVATDDCELLKIPGDTVRNLARSYPQIYFNIAANLASKAIKARIRAQILRLPNIECMVAKLFIELLKERDFDPSITDCRVVNGTFHLKDLAAFLGYEYHRTQTGVHGLIDAKLLKHYQSNKSGRFEICALEKLNQYFERELAQAVEQRKQKGNRKPD